jgi:hypothetical protein
MNFLFSVSRYKIKSHAQVVGSTEGARVEGRSLVRYPSLYYGKNQAGNFIL